MVFNFLAKGGMDPRSRCMAIVMLSVAIDFLGLSLVIPMLANFAREVQGAPVACCAACARGLREEAARDACPAPRRPLEARRPGLRIVDELEHRPAVFGDFRVVRARAVGQRVAEGRLVVEVALQRLVQPGASFP